MSCCCVLNTLLLSFENTDITNIVPRLNKSANNLIKYLYTIFIICIFPRTSGIENTPEYSSARLLFATALRVCQKNFQPEERG